MAKLVECEVLTDIRENGKDYKKGDKLTCEKERAEIIAKHGHWKILGPVEEEAKE